MTTYEPSPGIDLIQLDPQFPPDICPGNPNVNVCAQQDQQLSFLRISPSGQLMFGIRLTGQVQVWTRNPNSAANKIFVPETQLALDLQLDIGSPSEKGLTGLILAHAFDESSASAAKSNRYVFLCYTARIDSVWTGRVERYEYVAASKSLVNPTIIYENREALISANAHTLHGGTSALFRGTLPAIIVSIGDGNRASTTTQNPDTDMGKLLIMDYNGDPVFTDDEQPFPENALHLAEGNRNMYALAQIPDSADHLQRFVWGENGNEQERLVLYSLLSLDPSQEPHAHDLQWTGTDNSDWLNMSDPLTGADAVLQTQADSAGLVVSFFRGTEAVFQPDHHINTVLPRSSAGIFPRLGTAMAVRSFLGFKSGTFERSIDLHIFSNLNGAQSVAQFYYKLVRRVDTQNVRAAPLAVDIDPISGSVLFGDIFTGNVYQLNFVESDIQPIPQPLQDQEHANENKYLVAFIVATVLAVTFLILAVILFRIRIRRNRN